MADGAESMPWANTVVGSNPSGSWAMFSSATTLILYWIWTLLVVS